MFIDSHSHIQFPAYDEDRDAVILRFGAVMSCEIVSDMLLCEYLC